ncbi:MAG: ABC transporter ATP-binding protein [Acidimicrobiales bacterium]
MSREGTVRIDRLWKRFRKDRRSGSLIYEGLGAIRDARGRGYRWALRDIDLTFEPGESVGLIGPNGSGKSTLLKIIHGSMFPTAGTARMWGRPGALIEIHAGIHPHLTGRDNIYFAGALVGMRRQEVASRFDEIVEFAQIGDALDRFTKHYSSGMRMRLGFAAATALQPDVLLVDEVLAVGDEWFQRRSIDRMRRMHRDGTTIVYVSHDLDSVARFCDRTIRLGDGVVVDDGPTTDVIERYRHEVSAADASPVDGEGVANVTVSIASLDGAPPRSNGAAVMRVTMVSDMARDAALTIGFGRGGSEPTVALNHMVRLDAGDNVLTATIASLPLAGGDYSVWVAVSADDEPLLTGRPVGWVGVTGDPPVQMLNAQPAPVSIDVHWDDGR